MFTRTRSTNNLAQMFEPVEIFNGLIKGVILVAYDFVRLTVLGFLLPFFKRSRRIWPFLFAASKRLPSLTYLFIWVFIAVVFFSGNTSKVALRAAGLEKNPDVEVPIVIATVLIVTALVDVLVRTGFAMVHNRIRREVYEPLARITVANIFFGLFIVMTVAAVDVYRHPGMFAFFRDPLFTVLDLANIPLGRASFKIIYQHLYLLLFGIPLALVIVRAFQVRSRKLIALIGLATILIVPLFVVEAMVLSYLEVLDIANLLSPPKVPSLAQQFMHCSYASGEVRASGLLKLENSPTLALTPQQFAIFLPDYKASDLTLSSPAPRPPTDDPSGNAPPPTVPTDVELPPGYLGRGNDGQPPIVLTSGYFTAVTIVAAFTPLPGGPVAPQGDVECELLFLENLSDDSKPVTRPPIKEEHTQ